MSRSFNEVHQIGEFVSPDSQDAYFFFPHAVEKGILDLSELKPNNPHDAAVKVSNACIPAQAGTVALSGSVLAAYDLVSARFEGDNLIIGPRHKDAVETDSRRVVHDGLLTFSEAEGDFVKIIAEVADTQKAIWNKQYRRIGNRAVKFLGLDAPIFEITELDSSYAIAKPRISIFRSFNLLK